MNAINKQFSIENCLNAPSFAEIIRHWAAVAPSAPVLACPEKQDMSYGRLAELMTYLSCQLVEAGFGPGRRLALVHRGGPDAIAALLGIMNCASAVPLNPALSADELERSIRGCRVDGVLVDATLNSPVRKVVTEMGLPIIELLSGQPADPAGHVSLDLPSPAKGTPPELAQSEDIACIFGTSGTTNVPKIVPVRHRQLISLSQSSAALYELTPNDRSLNQNRLFLAGGIYSTCAALFSGSSVCFLENDDKTDLNAFFEGLTALQPTWFVASFNFNIALENYLRTNQGIVGKHSLRFIRVSSGRIDQSAVTGLERIFGVPVIEAYSSTESGRICGNPLPPQRRKHGTVGRPCLNSEVAILNTTGHPVPTGQSGEIVVRGSHVFDAYESNPAANEAAFIDGWYRTGDLGVFDEDGYLTLIGRIKEMINRGGEKIAPSEVDDVLNAHPHIADAAAFAIPHRTLGEIVGAALVPMPDAILSEQDVARFAEERLLSIKIPRRFIIVDQIPRGPSGKIKRHILAELAQQEGPAEPPSVKRSAVPVEAFDTLTETALFAIWQKFLKIEAIGLDDDFFILGGDSLTATQLVLSVNELFRIDMKLEWVFDEAKTIRTMAAKIDDLSNTVRTVPVEIDLPVGTIDRNISASAQSSAKENLGHTGSIVNATVKPGPFVLDKETGVRGLRPNWTIASIVSNSHGFRSPELPMKKPLGNIRVAFLGDSLTFGGWDSGNEETWPHYMMMALREKYPDAHFDYLIPTVIDQNPCAHLRMPRDMIFHGWSMRLFQAWQHSATMSS